MIEFFVAGKPVGKGRPRFTRSGHVFTPERTRTYEQAVAWECRKAMKGNPPSDLPQHVSIGVSLLPPKSWNKAKRAKALHGEIKPGKPDIDNFLKAILDGCNGIAFVDDSQVVSVYAIKEYAEKEGVRVVIEEENHG